MTLYIEQNLTVSSKTDNPENGIIRVTFKDITLSMSIVEASWLAANIQREIREVECNHPEVCGLSDAIRSNLKCGDIVTVRDDGGREADYEVKRRGVMSYCPICNGLMVSVLCWQCGGDGGFHDCGDDTCCCLEKDKITDECRECNGQGDYFECEALPHTEEQMVTWRAKTHLKERPQQ